MSIETIQQCLLAIAFYAAVVSLLRLAGKRLAGQTTTFDLVVLISLAVTLQSVTLREGTANALVFVVTVFITHRALAWVTAKSPRARRIVRGAPRPLIRYGVVAEDALEDEGLTYDDLVAGLRKLGHESPAQIRLATLEETGHISAIPFTSER